MSEETVQRYLTFNADHSRLLEQIKSKTGKDKRQIILDAIRLALSKGLEPARYQWIDKNHKIIDVKLPSEDVQKAKKLWKGRLTPLAVSGILDIAKSEGVLMPDFKAEVTKDIQRLTKDIGRISQDLQVLGRKLSAEEPPKRITDSTTAAKAVKATLRQLVEQLDYFKKGTEVDRKKFRETIDPMEVGYVTSILKALFDEEGFQRWILVAEFTRRDSTSD